VLVSSCARRRRVEALSEGSVDREGTFYTAGETPWRIVTARAWTKLAFASILCSSSGARGWARGWNCLGLGISCCSTMAGRLLASWWAHRLNAIATIVCIVLRLLPTRDSVTDDNDAAAGSRTDTGPPSMSCGCQRPPPTPASTRGKPGAPSARMLPGGDTAPLWAGGTASTARTYRAASD
jgi:hypothetical protein